MTTLWMAITLDRYELPIAVADTAEQLAARTVIFFLDRGGKTFQFVLDADTGIR